MSGLRVWIGALEFGFADGLGVLLESEDSGHGVAGLEALLVLVDFPADDGFGSGGFAAAIGEIGGGYVLEVVDVVDEAAFDVVHAGVDVARDGDVDEEHGAVAAAVEEVLAVGAAEELLRRAGGGDDDVGAVGLVVELVEGDDGAVEFGGDLFCAGLGAVGDENIRCALLDEVAGGELGHLAGSYQEDGFSFERAEDLAGEVYGDAGDGDGVGADLGFGADFFGYGEGALEEAVELIGDGSYFAGDGVGLFDLAEDLGLADDHAVEGAGYAEEMTDGFALAELVEVGLEGVRGNGEVLVEEAEEVGFVVLRGRGVFLEGEEFDAVAGGEDEAFADAGLVDEGASGVGEAACGDGEALAQLDGRGVVVDAEEDEVLIQAHGVVNLWTEESWLAAQTARTTRKTKLER